MQTKEERSAWLQSLKQGDEVVTPGCGTPGRLTYQAPTIGCIDRITKTQIIVGENTFRERRYRIADGGQIGSSHHNDKIVPATDQMKAEIIAAEKRIRFTSLPPKELNDAQIAAMLEAYDRVNAESATN